MLRKEGRTHVMSDSVQCSAVQCRAAQRSAEPDANRLCIACAVVHTASHAHVQWRSESDRTGALNEATRSHTAGGSSPRMLPTRNADCHAYGLPLDGRRKCTRACTLWPCCVTQPMGELSRCGAAFDESIRRRMLVRAGQAVTFRLTHTKNARHAFISNLS